MKKFLTKNGRKVRGRAKLDLYGKKMRKKERHIENERVRKY